MRKSIVETRGKMDEGKREKTIIEMNERERREKKIMEEMTNLQ